MEKLEGRKVTENIYLCPDGKYRWIYELNMLTNPTVLFTLLNILGIVILVLLVFSLLTEAISGNVLRWAQSFLFSPKIFIVPGILLVLILTGYLIVTVIYGFKYVVLFEMDENSVVHIQMPKQFKRAEGLAWLSVMAGAMTGNYAAIGAGILAGNRTSLETRYSDVRSIVIQRRYHTIKVNELIEKNQIYASDADFDFVLEYITKRCPGARIRCKRAG